MTKLKLRPALAADGPELGTLARDSFVAKFGYLYRPEDLATFVEKSYSPEVVAAELADPSRLCCLADLDGRLAGFCTIKLQCGWPEFARGTNVIELKQLYTDPEMTGRGIGATLMDWAMAQASAWQADEVQLSVWSGNHGAQKFYARYGFAKVADITFQVGEQVDEEFLFARML